ncbi:MAG: hypothetical protein JXR76_15865 [Deltaproteobacteria bacterium]|nr:hypothetical protein [Deltaproteobacteria bacterium]
MLFLVAGSIAAQAEESPAESIRPVVVIVSLSQCCQAEAWPEAEEKVRLEFTQGGIDVVVVQGTTETESERRAELMEIASEYNAAAAIRILKPPSNAKRAGVDLWISDRVTQKTVYRFLPLHDIHSGESSLVAALKTVELFKGSLQEIHLDGESKRKLPTTVQKMAETPHRPLSARKTLRMAAGFGGIFFARDVGFRGAPMIWFGWSPIGAFAIKLEGALGVIGRDIEKSGAASTLHFNSVSLKPMWVMDKSHLVMPAIGLAVGAAYVRVEGVRGNNPIQREDHFTALYVGLTSEMSFSMTESLWLTPSFDIGFIAPQARILFSDKEVAEFGVPVLTFALVVDVHF